MRRSRRNGYEYAIELRVSGVIRGNKQGESSPGFGGNNAETLVDLL